MTKTRPEARIGHFHGAHASMTDSTVKTGEDLTALSRMKAQRRRSVVNAIRNVREKVTSETGTRASFDHEMTHAYAGTGLGTALLIPLMAICVAAISIVWVEKGFVAVWLSVALAICALAIASYRQYINTPPREVRLRHWRRRFIVIATMQGIIWGAFFFLPTESDGVFGTFQFAAILIVVAVMTMVSSNFPLSIWASTFPISLAVIASQFIDRDPVQLMMAITIVGAQAFFISLGYRLYSTALEALGFQAEKDALIAELEQAKAISDESRRRSEEANLAKSRFLATMSHELRTPLNAILGFSEVLKNEVLGPIENDTYKEYAADIHSSGEHLLHLINEILDLSRIEAGRQTLTEEAIDLIYVAEDCEHLIALKAKKKNIRIFNRFEEGLPKVWADERALRQVILNILSNAVKFTPPGGEITIKAGWTAGGGQYVTIIDTGPGIAEEEIPIVLSAFGQGSIALKSAEQGTGLGLPICQALIKMHGGTFDFQSKLRKGTQVTITLPSSRVLAAMPAIESTPKKPDRRRNRR